MNPDEFLDTVRDDNETALSRLGSSKSLYAETEGEMEPETVFRAAAEAEHAASETFQQWADDEEAAESVRETFADFADEERDHYEQVLGKLDDESPADHEPSEVPAIHEYLRDLEGDPARVGGFLGRTLASEKSKEQMVGFFVGQADPQTAQLFRDLGEDLDGQIERGTALLDEVCESDEDWNTALESASGAIQAAYDEYTETLEGMGVNPKPVC
ncbi:rubrerythrin family protein [Halorussus lipolyticus]|uniref:rubrerythrin family protein n=1 Tax=Halorussus lipolyticus TaxID=3034024 RepID=UPI0023E8AE10|nr:rubrerythrin family protein [Halorussus sp. DT80]